MDKFEKILNDKLNNHEEAMPIGEWEKFSQRLDAAQVKPNPIRNYLIGGIAAVTIGFGVYYMIPSDSNESTQKETKVTQNITADNAETITNENPVTNSNTATTSNTVAVEENGIDTKKKNDPIIKTVPVIVDTKVGNNEVVKKDDNKVEKKDNNVVTNNENRGTNNTEEKIITIPTPEIAVSSREVCQNSDCSFSAANAKADFDITWLLNGDEVSHEKEFKVNFAKTGNQSVQLVYSTVVNGKRITKESDKRSVLVIPTPDASFEVVKLGEESIPEYKFVAKNTEGADYVFNCGDGKLLTGADATHMFRKKGNYAISLTVTGENGCKAKQIEKLEIENDYNLLAPNSFTPNGDGRNDVFIPEALKIMDVQFRMTIFDKSGKKIFETSRVDNAWDGRNTVTGGMCTRDAYIWRVEITKANGSKEEYMGSVTLLD